MSVLTSIQADRVLDELFKHSRMSNSEAIRCWTDFISRRLDSSGNWRSEVDRTNEMLEQGDPYLMQIVAEMMADKLSK